jgi:type III pantothenate kinase
MTITGVNIIALNIGNSRTQVGRFEDGKLTVSERWDNSDLPRLTERVVQLWRERDANDAKRDVSIVMASVNELVAERVRSGIEDQLSIEVYTVGDDMPIPIGRQLDPETITGVDRLLNAAAAYDVLGQACVIVDAGTAVTVDFVDGEGTFHGGAIAPGTRMQLRSLHENTSSLPELDYRTPEDEAFGRNTAEAMLQGVTQGIRGLVWRLVEQYAEAFGAYPMVIATGGDAEELFSDD